MKYLRAFWEFCSYLFVPQWGRSRKKELRNKEERGDGYLFHE